MPGNCGRKRLRVIHRFGGYPCGLTRDCRGRRAYSWIVNILCSECRVLEGRATGRTAGFQPRVIAHSPCCADMTSGPFLISCFDLSRRTCHFTRGIGFVPRSANLLRVIPPLSKSVQAQVRRTKVPAGDSNFFLARFTYFLRRPIASSKSLIASALALPVSLSLSMIKSSPSCSCRMYTWHRS